MSNFINKIKKLLNDDNYNEIHTPTMNINSDTRNKKNIINIKNEQLINTDFKEKIEDDSNKINKRFLETEKEQNPTIKNLEEGDIIYIKYK
jgi:TRAP-type mannitol/chloroaromatic compound transport system substrate-binding protein